MVKVKPQLYILNYGCVTSFRGITLGARITALTISGLQGRYRMQGD
jgi:hypothetical protein